MVCVCAHRAGPASRADVGLPTQPLPKDGGFFPSEAQRAGCAGCEVRSAVARSGALWRGQRWHRLAGRAEQPAAPRRWRPVRPRPLVKQGGSSSAYLSDLF